MVESIRNISLQYLTNDEGKKMRYTLVISNICDSIERPDKGESFYIATTEVLGWPRHTSSRSNASFDFDLTLCYDNKLRECHNTPMKLSKQGLLIRHCG